MEDKLYYKEKEKNQKRYNTNSQLCAMIRAIKKNAKNWEDSTLYAEFLAVAEKNKSANTVENIARLLAEQKANEGDISIPRSDNILKESYIKGLQQQLLNGFYGISEKENNEINKEKLEVNFSKDSSRKIIVYASLDEKTCADCKGAHGRIYTVKEWPLPHHPNCRCIGIPANKGLQGFVLGRVTTLPGYGKVKVEFLNGIHLMLDIAGLSPGIGNAPDLLNAIIYVAESDLANAALAGISAIPLIGIISGTTKIIKTGVRAEKVVKRASRVDDIITDGSHYVDGKLKPNTTYKTGEHNYTYKTNSDGLICEAHADLKLKTHKGRLRHNPNTPGKLQGDHAGHLFGDRFGGSPELDNLISQTQKANQGEYKNLENIWANELKSGKSVTIDIEINYNIGGVRPTSFDVKYKIDGITFKKKIIN